MTSFSSTCTLISLNTAVIGALFFGLLSSVSTKGNNALRALAEYTYDVNRFHSLVCGVATTIALILHQVVVTRGKVVVLRRINVVVVQVGRVPAVLVATVILVGVVAR